jgi:hypothetical protein
MFKTTVAPLDTHLHISIPKSLVGKEVEVHVKAKKGGNIKEKKEKYYCKIEREAYPHRETSR